MDKVNYALWIIDKTNAYNVYSFFAYYSFSYFRKSSHYVSVRNFYKL